MEKLESLGLAPLKVTCAGHTSFLWEWRQGWGHQAADMRLGSLNRKFCLLLPVVWEHPDEWPKHSERTRGSFKTKSW